MKNEYFYILKVEELFANGWQVVHENYYTIGDEAYTICRNLNTMYKHDNTPRRVHVIKYNIHEECTTHFVIKEISDEFFGGEDDQIQTLQD